MRSEDQHTTDASSSQYFTWTDNVEDESEPEDDLACEEDKDWGLDDDEFSESDESEEEPEELKSSNIE